VRHCLATHLYKKDWVSTPYAAVEQGFASALPPFVRDELEGHVACGVLSRGFAVFACPSCQQRKLVAFSCGGRGFSPSCMGRRMAQAAANWVDHILPQEVPRRQFVLSASFTGTSAAAETGRRPTPRR
jgi:hypothetical protein